MGRRRSSGGDIHGILLLDKRIGVSSNAALQEVKNLYGANKAGHTGSLDPLASGLLPVCMGEATKISSYLLNTNKQYQVAVQLGVKTTTGDAEGDVVEERSIKGLGRSDIQPVLQHFVGEIFQLPPMYSALKKDGVRLYELARQGLTVQREPRKINIYKIDCCNYDNGLLVLDIFCSKGTYIRSLAEDIGASLGCGAHVEGLRRTRVGDLEIGGARTIEQLEAEKAAGSSLARILPIETAVSSWPALTLTDDLIYYVKQGQAVRTANAPSKGWVRLCDSHKLFFAVGEMLEDGRVTPRRLFSFRP